MSPENLVVDVNREVKLNKSQNFKRRVYTIKFLAVGEVKQCSEEVE